MCGESTHGNSAIWFFQMDIKINLKESPACNPGGKRHFCYVMLTSSSNKWAHLWVHKVQEKNPPLVSLHGTITPASAILGAWSFPRTPKVHGDPFVSKCVALTQPPSAHCTPFCFSTGPVSYWMPKGNSSEDQPELCSEDNLLLTGILNNLFDKLKGI